MYLISATNIPKGRFGEVESDTESGARFVARHLSKTHAGVSFGVYDVEPGAGSVLLASFLNGERRFTAAS
jgi:hypothetical protein